MVILVVVIVWASGISKEDDRVVKIGYLQILSSYPLYVADTNGEFAKEGIKTENILFQSSNQLVDALVRGDVDLSPSLSLVPILNAEAVDSGKLQVFYASDLTATKPFDSLIVKRDSKIQTIKDLVGKKVGIFPGTTQRSIVKEFLRKNDVDAEKVLFVELPPQNQLVALSQGSIDALQAIEPNKTIAIETGLARAINKSTYAETYDHTPFAVGVITTDFVQKHSSLAKRVLTVLDSTNKHVLTNEVETRSIIAKVMNLDKNIADKVVINEYVALDPENIRKFVDFLVSIGELKASPDLTKMFYK